MPHWPHPIPTPGAIVFTITIISIFTLFQPKTEDHIALRPHVQLHPTPSCPVTSSHQLQLVTGERPAGPVLVEATVASSETFLHGRDMEDSLVAILPRFQFLQAVQVHARGPLATDGHWILQGHKRAGLGLEGGLGERAWKGSRG